MRSYRVHSCTPTTNGRIPYLVLSLVGAQRISLDMGFMQDEAARPEYAVALTMDALYDLLQGQPIKVDRKDGSIRLSPDGDQLVIQREKGGKAFSSHRVWMTELALAWNMLSGFGRAEQRQGGYKLQ